MYRIPAIESVNNIKRKCDTVPTNSNDTMQINTLTSWQVVSGSNSLNGISSNPFLPNSVTIKRISSRLISFAKMMMVDADDARFDGIMKEVVKVCAKVEPDCKILL